MKKALFTLLVSFAFLIQAGENPSKDTSGAQQQIDPQNQQKTFRGDFSLDCRSWPIYAGYPKDDTQKDHAQKRRNHFFGDAFQAKELFFKIVTVCALDKKLSQEQQEQNESEWDSLGLPYDVPYSLIKDMKDGDRLAFTTFSRKKASLVLTINNPRLSDSKETFQECLNKMLLLAKRNPNYSGIDEERLLKEKVLIENADYKKNNEPQYSHGPNGFDFSNVKGSVDQRTQEPPVQLILKSVEENKN